MCVLCVLYSKFYLLSVFRMTFYLFVSVSSRLVRTDKTKSTYKTKYCKQNINVLKESVLKQIFVTKIMTTGHTTVVVMGLGVYVCVCYI